MIKVVPLEVVGIDGKVKLDFPGCELADTPDKMGKGLAGRPCIHEKTAMLFDTPGPFWMKDVSSPLDIMFVRRDGTVLKTATMPVSHAPDHLARRYYPPRSAAYALETAAGNVKKARVMVGDKVKVKSCIN